MYMGVHVKHPSIVLESNKTWIFSKEFRKILKYQISWKFDQWEPSCSMRTGGQMDLTKLLVAFRNFANAPKTYQVRLLDFSLLRTVKALCVITYTLRLIITVTIIIVFKQGIYNYVNLKQTMMLGQIVLQLFCSYNLWYTINVSYFCISTFRSICTVHSMATFCSALISCFPGMFSGTVWVIFKCFQVPLLLTFRNLASYIWNGRKITL